MRTLLLITALACTFGLIACGDTNTQQSPAEDVTFEVAFENLQFERPLYLLAPPEAPEPPEAPDTDERRLYVVEQTGRITSFPNDPDVTDQQVREVLDIVDQVRSPLSGNGGNEEGLLGFAFHPDFQNNRRVFLHYSAAEGPRRNVLSEWTLQSDGTIDPASEKIILEVEQPWSNHNGGHIAFGPQDGYLYITLGDGGSGGDPRNNGQDTSTLLGSILRIDVDARENGKPYAIPDDNPFVNDPGVRPEIYAYGLRNVWRFSFDPHTGELWAGDVGQNQYEEIDIIQKGGNYGWNIREGMHPYEPDGRSSASLIDPVHEYDRGEGISVTGGYVYRGENVPSLQGAYIFADFGSGNVWMLRYENGEVTEHRRIGRVPAPASFGLDHDGELYVCSFDGRIRKLTPGE